MSEDDRTKAWELLRDGALKAVEEGALDTPEGRMRLAKLLVCPLVPKWGKAPPEARCLKCGAGNLERSFILAGGPFSGMVRCLSCGHQESVMSQIGKTLVTVEPLPTEA
jgi:hypothetical protein